MEALLIIPAVGILFAYFKYAPMHDIRYVYYMRKAEEEKRKSQEWNDERISERIVSQY